MYDYLIVGQGIAGSLLSHFLLKEKQNVLVVDEYNASSATYVASGIINPITGRRFVKTWLADELIPFAENTYKDLEKQFNDQFFRPLSIVKLLESVKAQNDWSVRCADPGYAAYLKNETIVHFDKEKIKNEHGGFEIGGGWQLDTMIFLSDYRKMLKEKKILLEEKFKTEELIVEEEGMRYKDICARKIIFCEGAGAINNAYFKFLPFQLAKGECLTVQVEGLDGESMITSECFIMPLAGKDNYYVGSTHDWNFYDAEPSKEGRNELEGNLKAMLNLPYKVIDQKGAIRPTVKDRRPFLGFHRDNANVGIFNGMGTKGISLAPYFAQHFAAHLVHGKPLLAEVDIKRFL